MSQSYIPFARKYRSKNFGELVGQEVLAKTLNYCIRNDRLAAAYVLTGIRGVGKTSAARIIAKTANCQQPSQEGKYIAPCNSCDNCLAVNQDNHPDIIEMDAASKTSIEDIRMIITNAEYKPLLGRYKFYIIDEVHMLSKGAFNALLKLLEEPPAHVVFILATTEIHKMPITVISRCQRYNLKRLTTEQLQQILDMIIEREQINIADDAKQIIIHKAEGSARDASSLLDQAVAYASRANGKTIEAETINQMLGLVDIRATIDLTSYILSEQTAKALEIFNKIYLDSYNLEYFIQSMADLAAELTKMKLLATYRNPLYSSFEQTLSDLVLATDFTALTLLWQMMSQGVQDLQKSHNQFLATQMLIIKAIHAVKLPSLNFAAVAKTNNDAEIAIDNKKKILN